jgi:replicative DNA helicase
MATTQLQLPPQNIEAEEAILGGILLDPNALGIVSAILDKEAFYLDCHKIIYQALLNLQLQNKPSENMILLADQLTKQSQLQDIGGRNKLTALIDRTVSAANIDALAKLVMEKYTKRRLMIAGDAISRAGQDLWTDPDDAIEFAETQIFEISQKQHGDRYQLGSAKEMAIELFEYLESGKIQGAKIGWYDLENLTGGLHKGKVKVIGAESHVGKTHVMLAEAYGLLIQGIPVAYISPEMDKKQLNLRMLAMITGIDSAELMDNSHKYFDQITEGIDKLSELPWKVYDHSSPTVGTIASTVRRAITEFGQPLGAVYIDYLQQIPLSGKQLLSYEIGQVVRGIRDIAKYHEVPIILGSQLNRSNANSENKRPNKDMLRNSGEIYEVCDQLVLLYRPGLISKDPSDQTIELIVEKNRVTGKLGTATMLCDLRTSRFMNLKKGY